MWFLANENFPLPSVRLLRQAGYDVASVTEDSPGIEDSEVLTRAANEQRVVITFDRDYGELIYRLRLPSPTGVPAVSSSHSRGTSHSIAKFITD
jgi:predicted nuclease of predicted toxin-antitoxin system